MSRSGRRKSVTGNELGKEPCSTQSRPPRKASPNRKPRGISFLEKFEDGKNMSDSCPSLENEESLMVQIPSIVVPETPVWPLKTPKSGKSNVFQATMNFVKSTLGAGLVGLPYALRQSGLELGILIFFGIAFLVDWTVLILADARRRTNSRTYSEMSRKTLGESGALAVNVCQAIFSLGSMTAYLIIIRDTIPSIVDHTIKSPFLTKMSTELVIFVVLLPLSMMSSISKLSGVSIASVVAVCLAISMLILAQANPDVMESMKKVTPINGTTSKAPFHLLTRFQDDVLSSESVETASDNISITDLISSISIITYSFVCHHMSFLIFDSLKNPSYRNCAKVTHWSMTVSLGLALSLAVPANLHFGRRTEPNVLKNFPQDSLLINSIRSLFAFNVIITYPIKCILARNVLDRFLGTATSYNSKMSLFVKTGALVIFTYASSLHVSNLAVVLELVGGLSATVLAFIIPPLAAIKSNEFAISRYRKTALILCIIFGLILILTCILKVFDE